MAWDNPFGGGSSNGSSTSLNSGSHFSEGGSVGSSSGGGGGGGGDVYGIGGLAQASASLYNAYQTNKLTKEMAERQMKFQKDLSNTAYQRQVADMRMAGLNPMLSANLGGASTPSGATGVMQQADMSGLGDAARTALQGRMTDTDIRLKRAQTWNTEQDSALKTAQTVAATSSARAADSQAILNAARAAGETFSNVKRGNEAWAHGSAFGKGAAALQLGSDIAGSASDIVHSVVPGFNLLKGGHSAKSVPSKVRPSINRYGKRITDR